MIKRDSTLILTLSLFKAKVEMNYEKSIHDIMGINMYPYLFKVVVRSVHQNGLLILWARKSYFEEML